MKSVVPTEFAGEPTTKMKSSKAKRQLSLLLNFFFHLYIYYIFSQVLTFTSVELNRFAKQGKLYKNLFFKRDGSHAISSQRKMAFSTPCRVVLWLLSPSPRVCTGGRASRPNFLALIGYQFCLAMVLHWRAARVGSATKHVK